jgi:hypothetical protein
MRERQWIPLNFALCSTIWACCGMEGLRLIQKPQGSGCHKHIRDLLVQWILHGCFYFGAEV